MKWEIEQVDLLKRLYANTPNKVLGRMLNRKPTVVAQKARKLGLKKSEDLKKSACFKKGHTPFNKGKTASDYLGDKALGMIRKTQFKKGSAPHNTKHDGAISIRKDKSGRSYKYIRISKSVWRLYHRQIWIETHGAIPEGYIVTFRDNNTMNCQIQNLELISRKENVLRNSKDRSKIDQKSKSFSWQCNRLGTVEALLQGHSPI